MASAEEAVVRWTPTSCRGLNRHLRDLVDAGTREIVVENPRSRHNLGGRPARAGDDPLRGLHRLLHGRPQRRRRHRGRAQRGVGAGRGAGPRRHHRPRLGGARHGRVHARRHHRRARQLRPAHGRRHEGRHAHRGRLGRLPGRLHDPRRRPDRAAATRARRWATRMWAGRIYVAGQIRGLGADAQVAEPDDEDLAPRARAAARPGHRRRVPVQAGRRPARSSGTSTSATRRRGSRI